MKNKKKKTVSLANAAELIGEIVATGGKDPEYKQRLELDDVILLAYKLGELGVQHGTTGRV